MLKVRHSFIGINKDNETVVGHIFISNKEELVAYLTENNVSEYIYQAGDGCQDLVLDFDAAKEAYTLGGWGAVTGLNTLALRLQEDYQRKLYRIEQILDSAGEWIANADIAVEPGWEGSRDYILRKLEEK